MDSDTNSSIRLTPRQCKALQFSAAGFQASEIAYRLNISHRTVHVHLTNARKKLKTRNNTHTVVKALELKLIEFPKSEEIP